MKLTICLFLVAFTWTGIAHGESPRTSHFFAGHSVLGGDTADADVKAQKIDRSVMKQNLRMISREEVPGKKQWERKKSARVAMFSSMLLPGLGQVYNGRRIKTLLMVGVSGFYMSKIWLEHKHAQRRKKLRDSYSVDTVEWRNENLWYDFHKEQTKDYAWWSGAVWIIGVLDAWIDAHLYDVRAYRPPREGNSGQISYLTVIFSF
jgi:hypothetical protein